MTWPQLPHRTEPGRAFLVERYLTPAAAVDLATSSARAARLCATDRTGAGVRYLYSAYLPTEDTCFCLFQAPSSDAVRAVNDESRFPFERLIDALLIFDATPPNPRRES